jgi:hypothetical protein
MQKQVRLLKGNLELSEERKHTQFLGPVLYRSWTHKKRTCWKTQISLMYLFIYFLLYSNGFLMIPFMSKLWFSRHNNDWSFLEEKRAAKLFGTYEEKEFELYYSDNSFFSFLLHGDHRIWMALCLFCVAE